MPELSYDFFNVNLSQRNQTYVNNTYQAYYIYKRCKINTSKWERLISQRKKPYVPSFSKIQLRFILPAVGALL
jgi:hypothetical protein